MSLVAKILLGTAAAVAATVVVVEVVSKVQEKTHKDDPSYKTIKEKAQEKAIEITTNGLLFASNHMDSIKTASSVVTCALPVVELIFSIYEFKSQNKIEKEIDSISKNVEKLATNTSKPDNHDLKLMDLYKSPDIEWRTF